MHNITTLHTFNSQVHNDDVLLAELSRLLAEQLEYGLVRIIISSFFSDAIDNAIATLHS